MNSSRKRVWLFAILMFVLLGLRLVTRIWLGGPHTGAPSQDVESASSVSAQNTPAVPGSTDAPVSGNVVSAPSKGTMSEVTALQVRILDQILSSKNDDDPRLDTDLKLLSEETKTAFRAKYRDLAPEKHNERGTIVFLLGRNLKTAQDYLFFKEVLLESPCLSAESCTHASQSDPGDQDHQSEATGIVLVYPQLTALKAIQKYPLPSTADPALLQAEQSAIAAARASRSPLVSGYVDKLGLH